MGMNYDFLSVPKGFLSWAENLSARKTFLPQEMIYQEMDQARQFYCLISGSVQIFLTSDIGIEKTLATYHSPALFGEAAFFDGFPRTTSARALSRSKVAVIDRDSILVCFRERPDLALSMITSLSRTVRMLSTQINQLSFLPAEQRLAQFLLEEAERSRNNISYSHEEIGSRIGCSRVTVSRTLKDFKENGWIDTGYKTIRILLPEALEKL